MPPGCQDCRTTVHRETVQDLPVVRDCTSWAEKTPGAMNRVGSEGPNSCRQFPAPRDCTLRTKLLPGKMNWDCSEGPGQRQYPVSRDCTSWEELPPGLMNRNGSEGPNLGQKPPAKQSDGSTNEVSKTVSEMAIQQQRQTLETIVTVSVKTRVRLRTGSRGPRY